MDDDDVNVDDAIVRFRGRGVGTKLSEESLRGGKVFGCDIACAQVQVTDHVTI